MWFNWVSKVINDNKQLISGGSGGDGNGTTGIDWIMLSNSYWLDDLTPCLNYGLRGVINASITIKSDKPDRHSVLMVVLVVNQPWT